MTYTLDQLKDEKTLRQAIGERLTPGPWKHWIIIRDMQAYECGKRHCKKCKAEIAYEDRDNTACPVPDSFDGDLAIAAERLGKMVLRLNGVDATTMLATAVQRYRGYQIPIEYDTTLRSNLVWLGLESTPTERCICCLVALGVATVEPLNQLSVLFKEGPSDER